MSVYTTVSTNEVEDFLTRYSIGALVSYSGITNGITNTNYWLETEKGQYVLTLYEHHHPGDIDYILGLQYHLAEHNVACAKPVLDSQEKLYSRLNNRCAAIVQRLEGDYCETLTAAQCRLIGSEMARFHLAGRFFRLHRVNPCGNEWRHSMMTRLLPMLVDEEAKLLMQELRAYRQLAELNLPYGPTHNDLFHDNCLFHGERLSGIIDFDYACDDYFISDIAICLNDCCSDVDGNLLSEQMDAFLNAYQVSRPLQPVELDNLDMALRLAATRFWLSRLYDWHFPKAGELTFSKDPAVFRKILLLRRPD